MIRIIDKTVLWIFGVLLVLKMDAAVLPVLVVLTALTMGACNIYFSNNFSYKDGYKQLKILSYEEEVNYKVDLQD